MRLLIFVNDETTIYNFRREIIRAFNNKGYDVILCTPDGGHKIEIERCGCTVVNIEVSRHGTNPIQELKCIITFRHLIRQYRPDVVLTYTVKPNIYGSLACQMTRTPYINNITGLGTVLQSDSFLARIMLLLQKKAYRKSSYVFFQNQSNYQTLLEKGIITEGTPFEILPGSGVNLELHAFTPMREDDGIVKFIIVSRIREDKGYNEFFDAAEIIKKKYKNTEFHVVGWFEEESFRERVEELSKKGTIIFHGKQMQEEVHKLIVASDCVVLPSYHEGMANVLLEAASGGRPVIATSIPGCRETFDDGITGFGCEVGSSTSLAYAMERLINVPYMKRREMGFLGRKKMEKEFNRDYVAERYINCIEGIVGGENESL